MHNQIEITVSLQTVIHISNATNHSVTVAYSAVKTDHLVCSKRPFKSITASYNYVSICEHCVIYKCVIEITNSYSCLTVSSVILIGVVVGSDAPVSTSEEVALH